MSRPNRKQHTPEGVGTSGQSEDEPMIHKAGNQRRLEAAHKHLDKMFGEAEGEQIDGRPFYGRIILEIPFEAGVAQEIQASKLARDRVVTR